MRKRMTLEKFLSLLPNTGWILTETNNIVRQDDRSCCPWIYVYQLPGVHGRPGKTSDGAKAIFAAADGKPHHNRALRRRLLKACGLS